MFYLVTVLLYIHDHITTRVTVFRARYTELTILKSLLKCMVFCRFCLRKGATQAHMSFLLVYANMKICDGLKKIYDNA